MKAQQKKLSGCASNLLAHEDLGHFEEAHHWNIQANFYNEKFPLVYESDNIGDYHEDHGATLKHKCGKRDSSIVPSLFFSHFLFSPFPLFLAFLSFFLFFCRLLWPLFFWGFFGHFYFDNLTWDNVLIMKIITLLLIYNSILRTKYDST